MFVFVDGLLHHALLCIAFRGVCYIHTSYTASTRSHWGKLEFNEWEEILWKIILEGHCCSIFNHIGPMFDHICTGCSFTLSSAALLAYDIHSSNSRS